VVDHIEPVRGDQMKFVFGKLQSLAEGEALRAASKNCIACGC
jgi:hypothetical protein